MRLVFAFVLFLITLPAQAALHIFICGNGVAPNNCADQGGLTNSGGATTGPVLGTPADQVIVRDANGANVLRLPVNPAVPLNTPTGWAGPASPPSSVAAETVYTVDNTGQLASDHYTSRAAACTAYNGGTVSQDSVQNGSAYRCVPPPAIGGTHRIIASGSYCSPGYVPSGSLCLLNNAAIVPKPADNEIGVKRTGNSYGLDSVDPDTRTDVSVAAQVVTVNLGEGRSATSTIDVGTGNTTVVLTNISSGNTVTNTTTIGTGSAPLVLGTSTTTTPGTGTGATGSPLGATECTSAGGNCASEATLKSIKSDTALLGTTGIKINETGTPTYDGSTFNGGTAALNAAATSREASITDIGSTGARTDFGWAFPSWLPSGLSCASWSFGFKGISEVVDWCPTLTRIRALWAWFLTVLFTLYVWRSAIGATAAKGS